MEIWQGIMHEEMVEITEDNGESELLSPYCYAEFHL